MSADSNALAALAALLGPANDPNVGWRSQSPSSHEHFRCEFCGAEHLDCTLIPHSAECPVTLGRVALAASPAPVGEALSDAEIDAIASKLSKAMSGSDYDIYVVINCDGSEISFARAVLAATGSRNA